MSEKSSDLDAKVGEDKSHSLPAGTKNGTSHSYEGHRVYGDALVFKSGGFHPLRAIKDFVYDLYHPVNYHRNGSL